MGDAIDELIEEVIADAYEEAEQIWSALVIPPGVRGQGPDFPSVAE
jgi:hypothetical protein